MDYLILIITLSSLLIIYTVYILIDDYKKEKYYNKNIYYITEWDKYESIIKLQKRIIFRKKIKLLFYKIRSKMK
ncbi:MAG: hypothetical protein MRZ35_01965 [Firmicutes bacterium]|nr:hypothetical protein [Bacillota bacterium]